MTRRPTFEEIKEAAERHIAYGWAKSPGSHNRDIVWSKEDIDVYNKEFDKASTRQKGDHSEAHTRTVENWQNN